MRVYILVDDPNSWIIPHAYALFENLKSSKHEVHLVFNQNKILECDVSFFLGCTSIVSPLILARSNSNIVVHPSSLPLRRGFSPLAWEILEGKNIITVTLFEAISDLDAGDIYFTDVIKLTGTELNDEIKEVQGRVTVSLCLKYIKSYGKFSSVKQQGLTTYYKRRTPSDSEIDPHKSLAEQFNLFRVADNKKYPVFFKYNGCDYILEIRKK